MADNTTDPTREALTKVKEAIFPRREYPAHARRNPNIRGDDTWVDERDIEREAIDEFIDTILASHLVVATTEADRRERDSGATALDNAARDAMLRGVYPINILSQYEIEKSIQGWLHSRATSIRALPLASTEQE